MKEEQYLWDRHCLELCSSSVSLCGLISCGWAGTLVWTWAGKARLLWLYNRESRDLEAELAKGLLKQAGFRTTDLHSNSNYTWGKFIWIFAQLEISFYCRQGKTGAKEKGEILLMLPFFITGCFVASHSICVEFSLPRLYITLEKGVSKCRAVWQTSKILSI